MSGGGRNIELKARLDDLASAQATALRLTAAPPDVQQQTDTYFHAARGRLKLREIGGQTAQLIGYFRADTRDSKSSDYRIAAIAEPAQLKAVLAETLGIDVVVTKRREISLYQNVRIHLDEVAGLGRFLEFEAVLSADISDEQGRAQLDFLSREFQIRAEQLVQTSYSDLLRQ